MSSTRFRLNLHLYNCLNVKELLARNRRDIWSLNEGSSPVAVTLTSDIAPVSSKEFHDIQATIECRFTLKRVRDMIIITYNHIMILYKLDSFDSQSILWSVDTKLSENIT